MSILPPQSLFGQIVNIPEIGRVRLRKKYVLDDTIITATHVYSKDSSLSFHVVSFIKVKDDKIISVDEYWGDDGVAPQWRLDKHIGTVIK